MTKSFLIFDVRPFMQNFIVIHPPTSKIHGGGGGIPSNLHDFQNVSTFGQMVFNMNLAEDFASVARCVRHVC